MNRNEKEHKVRFLNILTPAISWCKYSKLKPPQGAFVPCGGCFMTWYRNGSESACYPLSHTLLLNGLAAIIVFGCLERFLFRFPFCEFSLSFFALVVCHDVWKESASDAFDGVLWNVSVIDELFTSTQEFLLRMLVVEFEGVLGVFVVCVQHHSFRFVVWKKQTLCQAKACISVCVS